MYTLIRGTKFGLIYVVKVEDVKRVMELSMLPSTPTVMAEWRKLTLLLPGGDVNFDNSAAHIPITFQDFGVKW